MYTLCIFILRLLSTHSTKSPTHLRTLESTLSFIDWEQIVKDVRYGRCAVIPNWISVDETGVLRSQVLGLLSQGYFIPSGLRRTPSESDYGETDRLICEEWPSHLITPEIIKTMEDLDSMRRRLAGELCRPSMAREDLDHESYLSVSYPGASLARHLDERHEELRPSNRWVALSSILYYPAVLSLAQMGALLEKVHLVASLPQ